MAKEDNPGDTTAEPQANPDTSGNPNTSLLAGQEAPAGEKRVRVLNHDEKNLGYLLSKKHRIGQIGFKVEQGPLDEHGNAQTAQDGFVWVEFDDLAIEEFQEQDLKDISVNETSKLVAEFLGTFMFVFVLGANLCSGLHDMGNSVFGPTAIGCCLMVLVYSLAPISGGHINPSVTIAVYLLKDGQFDMKLMIKYIIAQGVGGCLAGLSVGFLSGFDKSSEAAEHAQIAGLGYAIGAPLAEFFYTFLLCFVFLNTSNRLIPGKESNRYFGVAIGFVIIAAHGASQVSGAALNPAVSLGVNFMGPSWKSLDTPISIAAQLFAGCCAFVAIRIVRPEACGKAGNPLTSDSVQHKATAAVDQFLDKYKGRSVFDKDDSAEFLGTFFICLTISLNAMIKNNVTQLWSVAASYMVMIWTLGDVSGGVFNPALTLAFVIRWWNTRQGFGVLPGVKIPDDESHDKKVDHKLWDPSQGSGKKEALKYIILQLLGGAAGTGATILIYMASGTWPAPHVGPMSHTNSTGGTEYYTNSQAFFAELCGTFLLSYVVLSVQNHALINDYKALAIGGAVIAAGYSFGPISGGFFNPSSTLACSIGRQLAVLTSVAPLMYLAAQLIGAALAAAVFKFATHSHEFEPPPPAEDAAA